MIPLNDGRLHLGLVRSVESLDLPAGWRMLLRRTVRGQYHGGDGLQALSSTIRDLAQAQGSGQWPRSPLCEKIFRNLMIKNTNISRPTWCIRDVSEYKVVVLIIFFPVVITFHTKTADHLLLTIN